MPNLVQRQSNIELLRIIAMFLVLLLHADFLSIGTPTLADLHTRPTNTTLAYFIEAMCIVCVNTFVMISGWFGIKPKVKSISSFLFQCLFTYIGIYTVFLISGLTKLTSYGICDCFFLTKDSWFIKAYLLLYILTPALNALTEKATKKQLMLFLIFFYLFHTVYGWAGNSTEYIKGGYSPISFIGLYVLSRYVRLYRPAWSKKSVFADITVFFGLVALNAGGTLLTSLLGGDTFSFITKGMVAYSNPLVIAASLFLLLAFSKFSIQNKSVNWIATSSFTVYLIHANPNILSVYYIPLCKYLNDLWGANYFILILPVLAVIFMGCILIDQIRIIIWSRISRPVENSITKMLRL